MHAMIVERAALGTLRREVADVIAAWRDSGRLTPRCDAWLTGHDREFTTALARRGLIGMSWPQHLGGRALSAQARLAVVEELLRHGAPVAAHWIAERQIGPALLRHGTSELQEEFLPAIARGEATFCLGMSETEAGSDLAAVRTRASQAGDGWVIDGAKMWTSHAHRAEFAYVLARTGAPEGADRHQGLTEFIVPMDARGIAVRPIRDMRGQHHFNEVLLDGVHVPARYVIGDVGGGWRQATGQLAFERGGMERVMSTFPVLEALVARGGDGDSRVHERVGALLARFDALREMAWAIARRMDEGHAPRTEAAVLKLLGTRFERDVLDAARASMRDVAPDPTADGLPAMLADAWAAAPGFTLRGGTSEVLTRIVGRQEARS